MSMSPAIAARTVVSLTGVLTRFAWVLAVVVVPQAAQAQSGSALFSVGEGGGRQQPSRQAAQPAARPAVGAPAARAPEPAPIAQPARAAAVDASAATANTRRRNARGSATIPIALNGRWHDSQCIPLTGLTRNPPLYVKRQYDFDDASKAWQLEAAVHTSDACLPSARLLTYRGAGSFVVTGKSRVASNAYDASFSVDRWAATPDTREGVLTLLNGRCGSGDFAEGRRLDLSVTGCPMLGIRPVAQSPRETELVSVSNGRFFLGSRLSAPGLGTDRPAQLSSYGLVRVP